MTDPRRKRLRRALLASAAATTVLLAAYGGLVAATLASRTALDPAYAGPAPLPPDVAARFDYPERGRPPEVVAEFNHASGWGWTSRWVQVLVTSPDDAAAHKVQIIHVSPTGAQGRRPAVVITPIMGGTDELPLLIARALARRGIHGAVVLRAETLLDGAADEARLERVLRTAIIDRRRALDWLEVQADVDPARLGALGVSLGGVTTALFAAVEPRVRASVIALAGGDLPDVIARSAEPRVARYVRERLAAGVTDAADLRRRIGVAVPSDPLALARHVDARRTLVLMARWDDVVPSDAQRRLHEALGRPASLELPTGHYSAAALLPLVLSEALGFLEERL